MVAGNLRFKQTKVEQLAQEMATLKRWCFAPRNAQLSAVQRSLVAESIDEDLEAIGLDLEELQLAPKPAPPTKEKPRRVALPAELPCAEFHHELEHTVCSCGCTSERFDQDVSKKNGSQPPFTKVIQLTGTVPQNASMRTKTVRPGSFCQVAPGRQISRTSPPKIRAEQPLS